MEAREKERQERERERESRLKALEFEAAGRLEERERREREREEEKKAKKVELEKDRERREAERERRREEREKERDTLLFQKLFVLEDKLNFALKHTHTHNTPSVPLSPPSQPSVVNILKTASSSNLEIEFARAHPSVPSAMGEDDAQCTRENQHIKQSSSGECKPAGLLGFKGALKACALQGRGRSQPPITSEVYNFHDQTPASKPQQPPSASQAGAAQGSTARSVRAITEPPEMVFILRYATLCVII